MNDKIKDKIEKLLNLSMSDNEHEAKLALEKAMKLMNEHNITEEEVYRQQLMSEKITLPCVQTPDWLITLYSNISILSGCVFSWNNGRGKQKAVARVTGRERDVQNAIYLIGFLFREVEKQSKEYKKNAKGIYVGKFLSKKVKSFKIGLIDKISYKLQLQQRTFFNHQKNSTDLVCIDLNIKLKDAEEYLKQLLNVDKFKKHNSKAQYDRAGLIAGGKAGEELEISQAVSGQEEIKKIGA